MGFSIYINEGCSGCEYSNKENFLKELSFMIDDCIANGGTYFSITIDADACCCWQETEDEGYELNNIDDDMGFDPYEGCYTYDC